MTRHAHGAPGRRPHVCTCHPGALSATQLRCVAMVADGFTNAEIAAALHLSPGTVPAYLTRARNKLGAKSREHMISVAFRDRLIGFDRDGRVVVVDELADRRAS